MNKTLMIFNHEFLTTIKRVGFIIMTFIVPLIGLLGIGISLIVSGISSPSAAQVKIGFIDNAGGFQQFTRQGNITLVSYPGVNEANQALAAEAIQEYFIVSPGYTSSGSINLYTLQKELALPPATMAAIKNFLTDNLLNGKAPTATVKLVEAPLNIITTRITATGEVAKVQGGYGNIIIPAVFSLLLVLSITFSSAYLMQSLVDEKENRLIEVLLSSVSTRQLIVGKVLGLGAAGLAQVVVWVVTAPLLLMLASSSIGGFLKTLQITPAFLVLCVVYFILGYLLFAVISTAIGAVSSSAREGQQTSAIFTLIAVSPLWYSSLILLYPDSPAFVALTIFPFTAPVLLMIRYGATAVPLWQIAASICAMLLFVVGGLFLTIRIVRVYLLLYGKRPGLAEIIRTVRNS